MIRRQSARPRLDKYLDEECGISAADPTARQQAADRRDGASRPGAPSRRVSPRGAPLRASVLDHEAGARRDRRAEPRGPGPRTPWPVGGEVAHVVVLADVTATPGSWCERLAAGAGAVLPTGDRLVPTRNRSQYQRGAQAVTGVHAGNLEGDAISVPRRRPGGTLVAGDLPLHRHLPGWHSAPATGSGARRVQRTTPSGVGPAGATPILNGSTTGRRAEPLDAPPRSLAPRGARRWWRQRRPAATKIRRPSGRPRQPCAPRPVSVAWMHTDASAQSGSSH